ncbi:hypothetical protein Aperf_G00000012481 [Anoplocephala perfoliata]
MIGSFLTGSNFTLICVLLLVFLLIPRPIGASFLNTTKTNSNGVGGAQQKICLKQNVEFKSSREVLENELRKRTKKFCSCGLALFQRKYCSSDFVVVAKKSSVEPQRFYPDPSWEDFNYAGLAVSLLVQQVLRGSVGLGRNIVVHFIQGSVCGVPSDMIPDGDEVYIIAGFRHTFFKNGPKSKETKELLLVTRCGTSEPLETLSITQLSGVFLNLYCRVPSCIIPVARNRRFRPAHLPWKQTVRCILDCPKTLAQKSLKPPH